MSQTATLIVDDRRYDLPLVAGTEGERAIDISKLRDQSGMITLDPAFGNTGACKSAITFIDGDKGILRYRGIPVEQFENQPNLIEVAYLLIFGHLPDAEELTRFSNELTAHAHLHEAMRHHFEGFPVNAPPMAMLSAMINTLSCFDPQLLTLESDGAFEEAVAHLMSKVRTIAAYSYRRSRGLPFIYPDPHLQYCGNLLHMMFSTAYEQHIGDQETEDALNLVFILHADHEQGTSTSTVRMVGSSEANLFASCAAGVSALWGPLHGAANLAVVEMLETIHKGGMSMEDCVRAAKDPASSFKLKGFGHRVYKTYDPRARMLKTTADRVLARLKRHDPLLDIARRLEEVALKDPYFVERRLYPNVDYYSGIILRVIGIPENMFNVMFAIGRMPGWIAHWKEQRDDRNRRIARPRQVYVGPPRTDYTPMTMRPQE